MLIIHYFALLYTNVTALIEGLINININIFEMYLLGSFSCKWLIYGCLLLSTSIQMEKAIKNDLSI